MLFDKRVHRVPRKPALVEPRESERPIVLHSLADEHGGARSFPSSRVPKTQRMQPTRGVHARTHRQRNIPTVSVKRDVG